MPEPGPLAILIGPMGVGKTSTGIQLAALHSVEFIDSDQAVEAAAGCSVSEIFAEHGEAAFRELEADTIAGLLRDFTGVLSLGGGAVTSERVRSLLRGQRVVRLTVSAAAVAPRLNGGLGRPLLAGARDPMAAWQRITGERDPLFAEVADVTVSTDGIPPTETARRISALLTDFPPVDSSSSPPEETA